MIHAGDCLEVMATLDAESIDAIVTDPPYMLRFMGKAWDSPTQMVGHAQPDAETPGFYNAVGKGGTHDHGADAWRPNQMQTWHEAWAREALRVAKPGAYLLAFGGTRTVHRMTCAIEDAGWIIRDMLVWGYACLSDDTEVLTSEGWVRYNSASDGQHAAAFDTSTGTIRWEPIEAVHRYDHDGPMAVVGPSLVTLNHRVVLEPDAAAVPRLPGVWNDVHEARRMVAEGPIAGVLAGVQREVATAGPALSDRDAGRLVGGVATLGIVEDDRPRQSGLEGRSYRVQEARELLRGAVRPVAGVGAADGPDGWLRDGTPARDGGGVRLPVDPNGVRQPREPRPDGQPAREPDALAGQPDAQALRMGQGDPGDVQPDRFIADWWQHPAGHVERLLADEAADDLALVGYRGVVWCITVPSGAFVARRNGVVFVTGNSGFPKSHASLKPAWEPIVLARKPGPLVMLNIDGCRIGTSDPLALHGRTETDNGWDPRWSQAQTPGQTPGQALGRWPANVVLTDPIFDGGWDGVVGGGFQESTSVPGAWAPRGAFPIDNPSPTIYGDSGTYSRFFLIPKAARSDREPVLGEYAYRLHRERGECDKLRAWDSADRSRNEPTGSTSPARATSEDIRPATPTDSSSDTSSPGSPSTAPSPTDTTSTTGTATSRTTGSRTSPSLIPSPTSASTPGANSETANGGSPAESAASSSLWAPPTGISVPRAGRSTDDADLATSARSSSRSNCAVCGRPLPRVGSHPTVKPVDLMRHLVRLVTPPGGTVLDPFLGSGTTALAAEMEGFAWVGIEREAEYVAIAEARLNGTQRGLGLGA